MTLYLDEQATTPLAPEARAAMLAWLGGPESEGFANPHAAHRPGRAAAAAVELAREAVAALLPPGGRVVFTSGATEALNMAIHGLAPKHIMLSPIEHAAVLDPARASGAKLAWLPLAPDGVVDGVVDGNADIAPGTDLVACMQVNNEIGTIQPVAAIAARAHAAGALLLVDASQSAGKLAPPEGADLIALSAHKLYGPKGIGALWLRDGLTLAPLIHGGGQEQGLRSGTLSPALCAGFGAAATLCISLRESDAAHVDKLWNIARQRLGDWGPDGEGANGWWLNGSATRRWRGNLNLHKPGLDVARLMSDCRDIAFSAGSACASGSGRPSHVLAALGLTLPQVKSSIRLGFGRYTDAEAFGAALDRLVASAEAQNQF